MESQIKLDCSACKQEKSMTPTKVSKMSPIVVFIGWIIALPSIFGVMFSIFMGIITITAANQAALEVGQNDGLYAATGLGVGFAVFIGIFSLVGGLLGYLLIMKKKVYKCAKCGFIINRD